MTLGNGVRVSIHHLHFISSLHPFLSLPLALASLFRENGKNWKCACARRTKTYIKKKHRNGREWPTERESSTNDFWLTTENHLYYMCPIRNFSYFIISCSGHLYTVDLCFSFLFFICRLIIFFGCALFGRHFAWMFSFRFSCALLSIFGWLVNGFGSALHNNAKTTNNDE